jgi:hypothetical protein
LEPIFLIGVGERERGINPGVCFQIDLLLVLVRVDIADKKTKKNVDNLSVQTL